MIMMNGLASGFQLCFIFSKSFVSGVGDIAI